jgi:hypothetical protein
MNTESKPAPQRFLTFTMNCQKLGRLAPIKTNNWQLEQSGPMPAIHFRGICECGEEHVGFCHVELG